MKNKLLIILTPFIILLLSFKLTLFEINYSSKSPDAKNVIDYLKNKAQLNDNFSEREKLHLKDVKSIINKISLIFYFLLTIYGLLLFNIKPNIQKTVLKAGKLSLFVIVGLLILIVAFFKPIFISMHYILFRNNLWLLPKGSLLLDIYPLSFFHKFAILFLIQAFLLSLAIILIGSLIKRFLKENASKNARGEGGAK